MYSADARRANAGGSADPAPVYGEVSDATEIDYRHAGTGRDQQIDLEGFADNTCGKVMDDFRGGDRVLSERRKPEYYNQGRGQQLQRGNQ